MDVDVRSQLHFVRGLKRCRLLLLFIACNLPIELPAQKSLNWKVYKEVDGLKESFATAVTVGPKGTVWVKHGETEAISFLDGYSVSNLVSTGTATYRVYESLSGRLWSVYNEGLQEYRNGQWIKHPIPEIKAENQSNLLRKVRPIPLLPAEIDHVFFLLPDRFVEYNAALNRTTVLREASQTRLGKFLDMTAEKDGGAWISGSLGLARLPGPVRKINVGSEWQEFLLDTALQVQNLHHPLIDDEKTITVVGDSLALRKKVMVHFDGSAWSLRSIPGENIRGGWRGLERDFWAMTINSLFRFSGRKGDDMEREGLLSGQNFDVATEPKGVFWLATSEGLIRCAPLPWRTPTEVEEMNGLVSGILEDGAGRLWFVSRDGLIVFHGKSWRTYPLPVEAELNLQKRTPLFGLPTGEIAINLNDRLLLFLPQSETFEYPPHPSGQSVKLLGQLNSGALCVQTYDQDVSQGAAGIELLDRTSFHPFLDLPPDWKGAIEPLFVYQSQSGDVWVGGNQGIAVHRQGQWQTFDRNQGYLGEGAQCLLETPDGKLWCGSRDRIFQFDGKKWSLLQSKLDRINAFGKSRDGSVWVASSSGLYCYSKGSWILNTAEDGLPSSTVFDVYEDSRGEIWAGTTRGLSLYHRDADVDPPKTFITKVNHKIKPSPEGVVTLQCSGTDKWKYTSADRLLYSYRLDNSQWSSYGPVSTISFTNLASGHHRLNVKAMDRSMNEDHDPPSFEFIVVLPWFKDPRLLASLVSALAAIGFFAGLAFNRHRKLVQSYAEVEQIVAQRTRELQLAHEELLHSQKMKALGTFAAGIAHDFNNILSIIKGSAQIIEGNIEDKEKIRTRVSRIRGVVDQGAGIVRAMLGYSRSGNKEHASYELNSVIEQTLKFVGDRFPRAVNIRVESNLASPQVYGSKDLMQQMLLNLILNAAEAIPKQGEIVLRCGSLHELPPELVLHPAKAADYVFLGVEDSGSGIAPDLLPRIFEPFFTTKELSTKRGTGLGLYMVYEFAKEMGYGLMVGSTIGKGTTFTIIIPIRSPAASG